VQKLSSRLALVHRLDCKENGANGERRMEKCPALGRTSDAATLAPKRTMHRSPVVHGDWTACGVAGDWCGSSEWATFRSPPFRARRVLCNNTTPPGHSDFRAQRPTANWQSPRGSRLSLASVTLPGCSGTLLSRSLHCPLGFVGGPHPANQDWEWPLGSL